MKDGELKICFSYAGHGFFTVNPPFAAERSFSLQE
jgi:hypothetical protein